MSVDLYVKIKNEAKIKGLNKNLLTILAFHANENKDLLCNPSQRTIAFEAGVSRETANRALKELADLGYITIKRSKRTQYILNMDMILSADEYTKCDESSLCNVTNRHFTCDESSHNRKERKIKETKTNSYQEPENGGECDMIKKDTNQRCSENSQKGDYHLKSVITACQDGKLSMESSGYHKGDYFSNHLNNKEKMDEIPHDTSESNQRSSIKSPPKTAQQLIISHNPSHQDRLKSWYDCFDKFFAAFPEGRQGSEIEAREEWGKIKLRKDKGETKENIFDRISEGLRKNLDCIDNPKFMPSCIKWIKGAHWRNTFVKMPETKLTAQETLDEKQKRVYEEQRQKRLADEREKSAQKPKTPLDVEIMSINARLKQEEDRLIYVQGMSEGKYPWARVSKQQEAVQQLPEIIVKIKNLKDRLEEIRKISPEIKSYRSAFNDRAVNDEMPTSDQNRLTEAV